MLKSAIRTGHLSKQGGKRKNWNKRYFVLLPGVLFYFKDEKTATASGSIPLEFSSVVDGNEILGMSNKKHFFGIITFQRTYFLQASGVTERKDWMDDLQQTVNMCSEFKVYQEKVK